MSGLEGKPCWVVTTVGALPGVVVHYHAGICIVKTDMGNIYAAEYHCYERDTPDGVAPESGGLPSRLLYEFSLSREDTENLAKLFGWIMDNPFGESRAPLTVGFAGKKNELKTSTPFILNDTPWADVPDSQEPSFGTAVLTVRAFLGKGRDQRVSVENQVIRAVVTDKPHATPAADLKAVLDKALADPRTAHTNRFRLERLEDEQPKVWFFDSVADDYCAVEV